MEGLNNRRNWNIADPNEGISLESIQPLSSRAESLIARSTSSLLREHFIQIHGVASILSGLTYHHDRFALLRAALKPRFGNDYGPIRHEAVAWVNRVGQLYYFVNSQLVRSRLGGVSIPTVENVMPFRHKHTAHRSFDAPRDEDSAGTKVLHAMSMSDTGGILWTPKSMGTKPGDISTPPVDTHYLSFQIRGKDNRVHNFALERDHPLVLGEGYDVLSRLLASDTA